MSCEGDNHLNTCDTFQGLTRVFVYNASPIKRMFFDDFQVTYRNGLTKQKLTETTVFPVWPGDYGECCILNLSQYIPDENGGLKLSLKVKGLFKNHLEEYPYNGVSSTFQLNIIVRMKGTLIKAQVMVRLIS